MSALPSILCQFEFWSPPIPFVQRHAKHTDVFSDRRYFWHLVKSFSLMRPFLAGLVSDCAFEICGDRTLSLELEIKINKWIYCLYIILSQGHSVLCRLIPRWARISKKYIFGAASWAYLEQSWPKKRKSLACTNIIHFFIFCIFEMFQNVT